MQIITTAIAYIGYHCRSAYTVYMLIPLPLALRWCCCWCFGTRLLLLIRDHTKCRLCVWIAVDGNGMQLHIYSLMSGEASGAIVNHLKILKLQNNWDGINTLVIRRIHMFIAKTWSLLCIHDDDYMGTQRATQCHRLARTYQVPTITSIYASWWWWRWHWIWTDKNLTNDQRRAITLQGNLLLSAWARTLLLFV